MDGTAGLRDAGGGAPSKAAGWLRRAGANLERTIALVCLAALLALRIWDPAPVEFLRLKTIDFYQVLKPREAAVGAVAIVDIDEESLAEIGQWPWPRTVIARLVRQFARYGVAAAGLDIVFPEPDRMSPGTIADAVEKIDPAAATVLRGLPSNDAVLAEALRGARVVLGQAGYARPGVGRAVELRKTSIATIGGDPRPFLAHFPSLVRNLPELERAASGLGVITQNPERDGIVRRVPGAITVGGQVYPTLALEILRVATGQKTFAVRTERQGVKNIVVQRISIPTDRQGRLWVYFAPYDPARYISAKDVLAGTVAKERLAGKLVLVGTSAVGLLDMKATPLGTSVPGVEVHAQLLETILSKSHITRPNGAVGAEIIGSLVIGLLMIVFVPMMGALRSLAVGMATLAVVAGGAWYLYSEERLLLDVSFPLLAGIVVYGVVTYLNYVREEAAKRQVRDAFSHYISPALVEQLAAHPDQLALGGEMKEVTLLFGDIRGFTTISEQFDAQGLTGLINRFLTPMTEIILGTRGTIDKYIGDCIMAFWNAPLDDPEHARNACSAALEMIRQLESLNQRWRREAEAEGRPHVPIHIGVGVNTGVCCVGNMGSDQRFDYSVLGDDVNLASRLEGQTKIYGVDIIIGENTRAQVPDYAVLEADVVKVKGKTRATRIYALIGDEAAAAAPEFKALAARHGEMLAAIRQRRFGEAPAIIEDCRRLAHGRLDRFYEHFDEMLESYVS